jgi:hypothetical protein
MKMSLSLLVTAILAMPAMAQPARDVFDAQQMVRAQERDMQPVLAQVRELGAVLGLFANVQQKLIGSQPRTALDDGIRVIDDYVNDSRARGAPLDRELRTMLTAARKVLDDARVGPPLNDVTAVRERLHHNFIHPLQRRAVQTIGQIDTIIGMYEGTIRGLRAAQAGVTNSVAAASTDPAQ